jgi:UDPglucose 6-dehydrogenase
VANIAVIGTGYVGLSTGACLSSLGHRVVCLDVDVHKIDQLRNSVIPIAEEGLESLVRLGQKNGTLYFTTSIEEAVANADVVFLCLPTPQGDDGSADLSFIEAAVEQIRDFLQAKTIVVNKSTVPVGTALIVREMLNNSDIRVVSNPEFLRQGTAVMDFLHPSRVVIGGDDAEAIDVVAALYVGVNAPILRMKTASAEALKYAANAFLATKLTFVNAIADICELVDADIFDVVDGLGLDPRIGDQFLNPGPGWGGSCFPKDTRALVKIAESNGYDFALLRGVIQTNDEQYERVALKVVELCGGSVDGKVVAAWGLTFKANTDDLRDSPSISVLSILRSYGAVIHAYDPSARGPYEKYSWIEVCESAIGVCESADVLVVLTEWSEFSKIKPEEIVNGMNARNVVDARNVLNRDEWRSSGFEYRGIGR